MTQGQLAPHAELGNPPITARDCWNSIGTGGDGSCPELERHIHCRNCPVFASAARSFFDRPAPERYLTEWTQWLAGSPDIVNLEPGASTGIADRDLVSVLIFRLGLEWMAFPTQTIAEVTLPRPVHRIPHRSNTVLLGLVNLRGQLQLCISLHGLLGLDSAPLNPSQLHARETKSASDRTEAIGLTPGGSTRLVVLRDREHSESWIFTADQVLGVHRLPRSQMHSVSSTLANSEVSFSQAILFWEDRSVSLLDEQRVFAALRGIGQ
jgi:chemotaxis-related protein WspD